MGTVHICTAMQAAHSFESKASSSRSRISQSPLLKWRSMNSWMALDQQVRCYAVLFNSVRIETKLSSEQVSKLRTFLGLVVARIIETLRNFAWVAAAGLSNSVKYLPVAWKNWFATFWRKISAARCIRRFFKTRADLCGSELRCCLRSTKTHGLDSECEALWSFNLKLYVSMSTKKPITQISTRHGAPGQSLLSLLFLLDTNSGT